MKLNRRTTAILAVPVLLVAPIIVQPAKAIFGIGDIVFDPSAYAALGSIWSQNISTYAKMVEEFNQLVRIYTNGYQLYQEAVAMHQSFSSPMRANWMMTAEQAVNNQTQSRYGETVMWPQVMNGSAGLAPTAWTSATVPLSNTSPFMGNASPLMAQRMQAQLAGIEIADGASVQCMQVVAQQHYNAPFNINALRSLGITFRSDSPASNSLIQQLNLGNAATQQSVALAHQQNSMQNCLIQEQISQSKMMRDQEVSSINAAIDTQSTVSSRQIAWDGSMPWNTRLP